jgi:hypothetical protein
MAQTPENEVTSGSGKADRVPELHRQGVQDGCSTPLQLRQVVVARIPLAQLIAPGFDGVPVSTGTTVKVLNLIAGLSKSKIGSPVAGSTPMSTPVACNARNVDTVYERGGSGAPPCERPGTHAPSADFATRARRVRLHLARPRAWLEGVSDDGRDEPRGRPPFNGGPNGKAGATIPPGGRTLRVVSVRDDDAKQRQSRRRPNGEPAGSPESWCSVASSSACE